MKHYTITVNGNTYEVSVEENSGASSAVPAPVVSAASAPAPAAPIQKAAPGTSAPKAPAGNEGSIKLSSPMPGKILSLKASVGQKVKKG